MYTTKRALLEHAVLPLAGAGLSALVTAVRMRNTKTSTKDKLKKLLRNATLGAMVGGGVEASRVGISNMLYPDNDLGNTTVDANFISS